MKGTCAKDSFTEFPKLQFKLRQFCLLSALLAVSKSWTLLPPGGYLNIKQP